MSYELKELAIGAAIAVFVLVAFRLAKIHRERGSYVVLLAAIHLPYVIFAVETHEPDLIKHLGIAGGFFLLAIIGARLTRWFVVLGFFAHAFVIGTLHYTPLLAPTPGWFGPMCLGFEVVFALGLVHYLLRRR